MLRIWCIFSFVAVLFVVGPACSQDDQEGGQGERRDPRAQTLPVGDITIRTEAGAEIPFQVELARTGEEQATGLMYRTEMADNAGMLFLFHDVRRRFFWMKNTFIPLDMVFIGEKGRIVHIHHDAIPHDLTHVPSVYPARAVLEINAGLSERYGIKAGDTVVYEGWPADKSDSMEETRQ